MMQLAAIPNEVLKTKLNHIELAIVGVDASLIKFADKTKIYGELNDMIDWICKDVGIVANDEYFRARFIDLVLKYYTDLSKSDVKLAFELSLIGELDEFLPKINGVADRNHYNRFSPEYSMKILNAYRKKRLSVQKKVESVMPEKTVPTAEEIHVKYIEWISFIDLNIDHYSEDKIEPNYYNPTSVLKLFKMLGITQTVPKYESDEHLSRGGDAKKIGDALKHSETAYLNGKIKNVYDYLLSKNKKVINYVSEFRL
jgi:hypothetical protein